MEQLTIDTGLREYAVNGGPEHGGGVLRFNPSDPNVYSRFCTLQNQLQELEQQVQAQSPTGTDCHTAAGPGGSARQGAAGGSIWPRQ